MESGHERMAYALGSHELFFWLLISLERVMLVVNCNYIFGWFLFNHMKSYIHLPTKNREEFYKMYIIETTW